MVGVGFPPEGVVGGLGIPIDGPLEVRRGQVAGQLAAEEGAGGLAGQGDEVALLVVATIAENASAAAGARAKLW